MCSKKTTITFGQEARYVKVNEPIDREGWNRLRYVLGAGGDVAAKVGVDRSKNHGLDLVCWRLHHRAVCWASNRTDSVRGNEANPSRFFPAGWPPVADPTGLYEWYSHYCAGIAVHR